MGQITIFLGNTVATSTKIDLLANSTLINWRMDCNVYGSTQIEYSIFDYKYLAEMIDIQNIVKYRHLKKVKNK